MCRGHALPPERLWQETEFRQLRPVFDCPVNFPFQCASGPWHPRLRTLIQRCTAYNPDDRWPMSRVLPELEEIRAELISLGEAAGAIDDAVPYAQGELKKCNLQALVCIVSLVFLVMRCCGFQSATHAFVCIRVGFCFPFFFFFFFLLSFVPFTFVCWQLSFCW